jgi:hypothetical protein
VQILGSLAALLTAGLFLVAGIAKLGNRSQTANGFVALGLSKSLVTPIATLELLVALLVCTMPRTGSYLAVVVLLVFSAFLVRKVRNNQMGGSIKVRCNCFGGSAEVSRKSVARNVGFLALAAAASQTSTIQLSLPAIVTVSVGLSLLSVLYHVKSLHLATGLQSSSGLQSSTGLQSEVVR